MMKKTELIKIYDPQQDAEGVRRAAELLRQGGLVAIPTETVYGLAADACNAEAVRAVYAAKGRPSDNPMIVHIADREMLPELVASAPPAAALLADAFWPGPLTMVLPRSQRVPLTTTGGLQSVAVRMPSHPLARAVIRPAGVPLAAPSGIHRRFAARGGPADPAPRRRHPGGYPAGLRRRHGGRCRPASAPAGCRGAFARHEV